MSAVTRLRVSSLDLVAPVLAGKITAIARLMSRVESGGGEVMGALEEIYRHAGKAHIVGITGVPGRKWFKGFFSIGSTQKPDERPYVVRTISPS